MQRDMDLIRELLLSIEANPHLDGSNRIQFQHVDELGLQGRTYEEVVYHLRLLIDAKYVAGVMQGYGMPILSRMTWEGHEFLDNIRDNGVWHSTKERLKGLPTIGLSVVAELAKAEIKRHLGLP